jgi:chromosome partitioning protein
MTVMNTLSGIKRLVKGTALETGTRHARVIAVSARKGGVGKTTTSVNLAASMARYFGKKVLLVDMDSQGHVSMSLRQETRGRCRETLSDVLLQKRRDVYELVQPTSIDGLWFIESDAALHNTEAVMGSRIGKELLLRNALRVARTHFDLIVIDCPPNLGCLTVNALVAADRVLIPCALSSLSLDGVDNLLEAIETVQETLNPRLNVLGLLRTRVDRRNQTMNSAIEKSLNKRYSGWMLNTCIGVSSSIAKAQHAGQPVLLFEPKSTGADYYRELACEIDSRLSPQ